MPTRHRPIRSVALALTIVAVIAAAVLVTTLRGEVPPRHHYVAAAENRAAPLRVTVVGDSFAAGVGADAPTGGYAYAAAARGCWTPTLVASSGTGYARVRFPGTVPFTDPTRLAAVAASNPDVVVVQGSGNDVGDDGLRAAATAMYAALAVIVPRARVVVVGPTDAPAARHENIGRIRTILAEVTRSAGVPFVDPAGARWLDWTTDYVADGIHPNAAGHRAMGERLAAEVAALGVPRADGCRAAS
ncbi:SGNH/GDSL hydrolase family protein [Rhodococcoides corynebacterioides]|uniref:SGNH/GDSL hydrolase family protein n=1 Tax=Rhodococcoides corynebacterioides TaxID=53972 RepID=A0ABS7P379_9NOCA|nr:SGNH/GDSL hydrolase family protein [Rhodococcus corynebacterioides]MBY6366874.1 SGNH/GDSL hydrolase family protein [Rhodococcus corynebacterioides]MBY6409157.1 SGNH/GDSL hydrolase family protein [Rhodococcus corynebacterioides]